MGIFANLLLKNHAGAEQTWIARSQNGKGWYQWFLELGASRNADPYLNHRSVLPDAPEGTAVHEYWITRPRVDAPAAAPGVYQLNPRVVARNKVQIKFEISGQATLAERQELLANARDLLADTMLEGVVVNYDLVRG